MARARSIKPGFFKNADLLDLPFEVRLLFAGLWTLADREGRLEDKPKQIKIEIFPSDNIDCNAALEQLSCAGLISRYEHSGKRWIQVITFTKHQNPHKNEAPSTIPAQYSVSHKTECLELNTVQAPCKHSASTVRIGLTPDSGLLTPDSPFPGGERERAQAPEAKPPSASPHPPIFSDENRDFAKTERPDIDAERTWASFCDHYDPEKQTSANWRKWVRREVRVAFSDGAADPPSVADPDSRSSVEAVGLSLGIGRWDQLFEPWMAYKNRVKTAVPQAKQVRQCH